MVAEWVPWLLAGTKELHGGGRGVTVPVHRCCQVQKFLDTLTRSGNIDQVGRAACSRGQHRAGGRAADSCQNEHRLPQTASKWCLQEALPPAQGQLTAGSGQSRHGTAAHPLILGGGGRGKWAGGI